mgnify:FL=1
MYKKLDVYVNGKYEFSTNRYRTPSELWNHIRAIKHLEIASVPNARYLTVNDYDVIVIRKGEWK